MRERVTKFISVLFITISYLVTLFPFYIVYASDPTYAILGNGTYEYRKGKPNDPIEYITVSNASSEVRFVTLYLTPTLVTVYGVSLNSFQFGNFVASTSNGYYYAQNSINLEYNDYLFPAPIVSGVSANINNAIYYTFGNGAIDPEPEISFGDLIIEGFSTDIAGQGEASINNIDHIKWNGNVDVNGNDISNLEVRLQIVPGTYTADSKAHLLEQTYEDLIIDINNAHDQVYDASIGEVSFKWSDIVNMLNITSYKLWSLQLFGVDWQKEGWIYRIRLEDSDNEYVGNWQTIYSSTSSGVENDLTIINSTTIDQTYITALQEVNNLNTVNNNWIVNNTEISVTNEYTEPQQGEKPWWAYLLESILNTFNITNNYIYEGDSNTQNITNTVNDSDDDMNRKIGEYQQFEDTFIDDMDSNLTDIDTNIDFLSDNKFIASANWVAQQYNRMTTNNIIGSFIGFSLLFGLALIFIGKIH